MADAYCPKEGDWVRISYMDPPNEVQVVEIDDYGNAIVVHPHTPGIGPMSVEPLLLDFICHGDDKRFCVGDGI